MKQTLSRHAMTFVLLAVLVWYTAISPSYAAAPRAVSGREPSEDAPEFEGVKQRAVAPPALTEAAGASVDDLDWPEFIGED